MKKSKLLLSLAMMCLSIAVLCFGVLAAQSVNYTITGTISYEVNDAFVEMKTSVWYTEQYLKGQSLDVCDAFASNLPASGNTYGFVQDTSVTFDTFNSLNNYPDAGYSSEVNISLGTNKTAMIIVEVTNLGEKDTWVVAYAKQETDDDQGGFFGEYDVWGEVYGHVNYIEDLAKGQTMNFIIFITPDNLANELTGITINVPIFSGVGDYVDFEIQNNFFNLEHVADGQIASYDWNEKGYVKIPTSVTVDGTNYIIKEIINDEYNAENFYAYNLDIPEGIDKIKGSVGYCGNYQLKEFRLPAGINEINVMDSGAYECKNLERIVVKETTDSSINRFYTNADNNALYERLSDSENGYSQLICVTKNVKTFTVGDKVSTIYEAAFICCEDLTSVTIPSSVESIGREAFNGCTSLTSITIPSSVERLGVFVFNGCTSLTSITIPSSVKSIDYRAFARCDGLSSVTFEDPNNWFVTQDETATSGTNLTLTNPATNATYLKTTYNNYYWKKSA